MMNQNKKGKKGIYICHIKQLEEQVTADEKILSVRLVYKSESGRVGLDSDKDGEALLDWLLKDAWAWNNNKKSVSKYSERHTVNGDPFMFLATLGVPATPTQIITYHCPYDIFIKRLNNPTEKNYISTLPLESRESLCQKLPNLTDVCEMIILWNMLDREPLIFTKKYSSFYSKLKAKCKEREIDITTVENENELPEW